MQTLNGITLDNLDLLVVGENIDWKFGVCTREVSRISNDSFEINDFSCGWTSAIVNKETMEKLTAGEVSLLDIYFE